jgi:hypothetical protein
MAGAKKQNMNDKKESAVWVQNQKVII